MRYEFVTAGEQLAYFVDQEILTNTPWSKVAESLVYTGRSDALCEFFREIAVVNLTCRVVTAGTSLLKESVDRPARLPSDASFEKDFRDFILDRLNIRPPLSRDLLRNALRAVESARHDATAKEKSAFKSWAQRMHRFCYMCGVALDFSQQHQYHSFSLEHIWPQRYGGDSIEDNWLPSCVSCNSAKKRDFATWAMPSIQSLVLGFDPSEAEYATVDGSQRFAMHNFVAKKVAIHRNISLKRAFLTLNSWRSPRLRDDRDLGDFFNIVNHRADFEIP